MIETMHSPTEDAAAFGVTPISKAFNEGREPAHATRLPWRPGNILMIFGAWTLFASLISAGVLLNTGGQAGRQSIPVVRIILAFIEAYLWAGLTPLIFWLVRRFATERYNGLTRAWVFTGAGIVMAVTVAGAVQLLRRTFSAGDDVARPFSMFSAMGISIEALTYTVVLIAGFARHYLIRFQAHREQTIALQAQLADARLTALRAQLSPHFLFNTLHAISALSETDPPGVRRMLSRLSDLLRITLNETDRPETILRRELLFVRQYLELMRIQLQSNIEINEDIDEDVLDALVPTFILQPLIENAIKHGISRTLGPGRLTLSIHRVDDKLKIVVRNNGPLAAIAQPRKEGVGLSNTRERLSRLYGDNQVLTFHAHKETGGEFITEVVFPFHTTKSDPHSGLRLRTHDP
jgi:two-component system, LytTR family, sensor kinase